MTVKVIQCDHKKRLEGYWDQLFVIGKKWEEDLKALRKPVVSP